MAAAAADVKPQESGQEWAEICYVPAWAGDSRQRAIDRSLAIREKLAERPLDDAPELPFPTQAFGTKGTYKLFGVVTNRKEAGDTVIWWHRERCGDSEQAHAVVKSDLAGGQLPSQVFGANAAWWAISRLTHNLTAVMQRLALGQAWIGKRMKAMRFRLSCLPGRESRHARRLNSRAGCAASPMRSKI